jgi:hypothetical protein
MQVNLGRQSLAIACAASMLLHNSGAPGDSVKTLKGQYFKDLISSGE